MPRLSPGHPSAAGGAASARRDAGHATAYIQPSAHTDKLAFAPG